MPYAHIDAGFWRACAWLLSYPKSFTQRDIREVNMTAGTGTTYWWYTGPVIYPFGWGLSYVPGYSEQARVSLLKEEEPQKWVGVGGKACARLWNGNDCQ